MEYEYYTGIKFVILKIKTVLNSFVRFTHYRTALITNLGYSDYNIFAEQRNICTKKQD